MKKRARRNRVARQLLATVRREQRRRLRRAVRREKGGSEWAFDVYRDVDEPFINDLCLTLLVYIWHQLERELIGLAARVTSDGRVLSGDEYRERVGLVRTEFRSRKTKSQVIEKLGLKEFPAWTHMETLRQLANCYKHDPSGRPDPKLLGHLKMPLVPKRRPLRVDYAPLPESDYFRAGLARSLSLEESADYCAIVDAMLSHSDAFLHGVEQQDRISDVRWGAVSLNRFQG